MSLISFTEFSKTQDPAFNHALETISDLMELQELDENLLTEEFLESTKDPYYSGEVDYGDRAEHCWNGDHSQPNAISRLRYHQMFIPKFVDRMMKTAPAGSDLNSWRY